jgi:hypothetical protein
VPFAIYHYVLLKLAILIISGEKRKLLSFWLFSFLQPTVTSSFLAPSSSLNVKDQVSHPPKTTGKIILQKGKVVPVFN